MKRKIIELGNNCMVMSLPRKWVLENNLEKGVELDVDVSTNQLKILAGEVKKPLKETSIYLTEDMPRTSIRSYIVNLYRGGFDKINITFLGDKELLYGLVDSDLMDFELFEKGSSSYSLEELSKPTFDNYEQIVEKIFYILNQIIKDFDSVDSKRDVYRMQKYDNFIKRCMTKGFVSPDEKTFLWQFFSDLIHVGKELMHFQFILNNNFNFSDYDVSLFKKIHDVFTLIKKSYFKNDVSFLFDVHKIESALRSDFVTIFEEGSNEKISYYVLHIIRILHLSTSPLLGALELRELN